MKHMYIILSRSQTLFAKAIRLVTRKYYNHTSVAFDPSLDVFYSFGRRNPRRMFPAGFITEGVHSGFFGIHPKTPICVLELDLTEEQYQLVQQRLRPFIDHPMEHKYGVQHVVPMALGFKTHRDNKDYVCSVFAAKLLENIYSFEKDFSLVYPEDFYKLNPNKIYEGTAGNYNYEKQSI